MKIMHLLRLLFSAVFVSSIAAFTLSNVSSRSSVRNNINFPIIIYAGRAAMPEGTSDGDWDKKNNINKKENEQDINRSSSPPFIKGGILPEDMSSKQILSEGSSIDDNQTKCNLETQLSSPDFRLENQNRGNEIKNQFLHGDQLIELRKYISNLQADLLDAREKNDISRISDLNKALHESKNLDAEEVYREKISMAKNLRKDGHHEEAEEYLVEAIEARDCLPQFNLSGLWVGKYGEHGYEMINVTYTGDTLVAYKITGDKNVPKGEITFTTDLSPDTDDREGLEPIELSDVASKQWGHKHLPRFTGKGQVAAEGFTNNTWMEGQLILVGEYFSFAWIPIGHQIFFGRPSADLTLKMLKRSKMAEYGATDVGSPNAFAEMRAFAQKCYEETEMLADDDVEGELCFLVDDDDYFCQEGCFE